MNAYVRALSAELNTAWCDNKTLDECKAAARAKVWWMRDDQLMRPEEVEEPPERCYSAFHDSPFLLEYYPTISRADFGARYRPCHQSRPYEDDDQMISYDRLGGRLARTGKDTLPSAWIHAHANDRQEL